MPSVTYTINTAGLTELKEALAFHRSVDSVTNADLKAWGKSHFDGLISKYREHLRDTGAPVDTTSVVS